MHPTLQALRPVRRLRADRRGSVAVEFALLVWPVILLVMGGIQLAIYQYTQLTLSNALFDTASDPEPAVLLGNQAGYKSIVCARIRIMPAATCEEKLLVEMTPLAAVPTGTLSIQGAAFSPGLPMNLLVLRAAIPAVKIVPLWPPTWAKASVVFRRS
ncbi:pilus assembly protein [Methylobacterium sp. NEAU 140]|uniref:TadE/TadG family type IV pilus assembly protein n=1 Tax=Methylobacterium sp. NEAU 140 TaxID=3064945 RepID=UPI002734941A|nr:TadE/TadG family type IV pilus assembly protein [Methylobacterium sp. NEAU 140]MDP4022473.1 pilus assembly protein [Methylobacterium sp. NEAU 140]